jgi:hypothetical protein
MEIASVRIKQEMPVWVLFNIPTPKIAGFDAN